MLNKEPGTLHYLVDSWYYARDKASNATRFFFSGPLDTVSHAIQKADCTGLVMEFGVAFAISINYLAREIGQEIHGFDSFHGLPGSWGDLPQGTYSLHGKRPSVLPNVKLNVGLFEQTLPEFVRNHKCNVRLLNVDCDTYDSTKTVFR